MRKAVIIAALVFAAGILFSSCNKQTCPAYSQADNEQVEQPA